MDAIRFPALPDQWETRCVAVHDGTGCWLWTDPRIAWDTARVLIADAINHTGMDLCGITPTCVKPSHGQATTRPIAGGAA